MRTKIWLVSAIITLGIISTTPSIARANDFQRQADEILRGALQFVAPKKDPIAYTHADTSEAFILLGMKTAQVTDVANILQADLSVCTASNERFIKYLGYEDRSIVEKISQSSFTKVAIFIIGFWIGAEVTDAVD